MPRFCGHNIWKSQRFVVSSAGSGSPEKTQFVCKFSKTRLISAHAEISFLSSAGRQIMKGIGELTLEMVPQILNVLVNRLMAAPSLRQAAQAGSARSDC